jgi:hypothetical protein
LLACFTIHGKPVGGNFKIQVPVTHSSALQLGAEGFGASGRHEVLHCLIDEPAALAGLGHAINGLDGSFRQNDVDAFARVIFT